MSVSRRVQKRLRENHGTPEKVKILAGFFKCGKGEYGEGDVFLGVTVPIQRAIAKQFYREASHADVEKLLESAYHEDRLTGLFLWVYQFENSDKKGQKEIYRLYLANLDRVNNWDLVDTTTPNIVGAYMWEFPKERVRLTRLARSKNLWHRRMAILATYAFIKQDHFEDTLRIAEMLLDDQHDLIHKAVGWMLREVGKRDKKTLVRFLDARAPRMPRTMLRYAIEKFSPQEKSLY